MFDLFLDLLLVPFTIILLCLWGISILIKQVSFIDAFWSMGFVVLAWMATAATGMDAISQVVILAMVSLWGVRLSYHLLTRWWGEGEDKRYIKLMGDREGLRRHIFSLIGVFGLQGAIILIISAPLLDTLLTGATALSTLSYIGIALFAVGLFFEVVGDAQLRAFKANPDNKGKVLNTGLWRYTRHPNYFGDACIWWGMWMVSANLSLIFAPIIMTALLYKGSGVPILERNLKKNRPGYEDYIASTSTFIPMPPKQTS